MTAPVTTSSPTDPPTTTVLGRAAAAEWIRLWTLRSTWWSLFAAAGLILLVSAAVGSRDPGGRSVPIWHAAQVAIAPGQFAFLLLVVLAVPGEHAAGAIRSTLQWVPRRGVLFAARVVVPVVFASASAAVIALAADLVTWAFLGEAAEIVPADIAASLGRIALVIAFGSVLTVGFGLFLRSTAGTLTALFLVILALPIALGNTGITWLIAISDHLPGRAIISMLVVDEIELAGSDVATVMIAWTAAALCVGGWSLIRRDST